MITFILVTFLIPPLILAADYVQKTELTLKELIQKSGPDLCSISLGSSIPVFLDSRVRAALAGQGPAVELIGILLLFIFRGICIRLNRQRLPARYAYAGTVVGITSVSLVGVIMIFGYL
jgi:hypothetical protein